MKKTILIFGLFAGISGAGQNKDLQDIDKMIKVHKAKEKTKIEKPGVLSPIVSQSLYSKQNSLYVLPNGDMVYYGAIDNMPIVRPDMRNFTNMPTLQNQSSLPQTMPNAARKFYDLGVAGPNHLMDQLAPSPVLDNLLKIKPGN